MEYVGLPPRERVRRLEYLVRYVQVACLRRSRSNQSIRSYGRARWKMESGGKTRHGPYSGTQSLESLGFVPVSEWESMLG